MADLKKHSNNISTTLNGSITNVQTTITVNDATGLPAISGSEYYALTIDDGTNIEIVHVTDDASSPTLTVTRGQEGTSGTAFADADKVQLRVTADDVDRKQQEIDGLSIPTATVATNDKVLIQDTDDSDNLKTATTQNIANLKVTELSEDLSPVLAAALDCGNFALNSCGLIDADAGITFNNGTDTLDTIERGTFTPVVADASSGGNTASNTTEIGRYLIINDVLFYTINLTGIDTTGMTGANQVFIRSLPYASASVSVNAFPGNVSTSNITVSTAVSMTAIQVGATSYTQIRKVLNGANPVTTIVSDLTSGSAVIEINGWYEV